MKILPRCAFLLWALAAAPAARAQPVPLNPVPIEEAAEGAAASPAMWRVRDEDSDYILLGTFHVLPPALNWRSDALDAAMQAAETVYFETDPDDMTEVNKVVEVIQSKGVNAPGVSLFSMLGSDDGQALRAIADDLGIAIARLEPLRPWNAFLALGMNLIVSQGYEPGAGVDRMLVNEAKLSGKDIRYFETLSQQIELFATLPPKAERDLLLVTIRRWDEEKEALPALLDAWANGDVDYMDDQLNSDMRAVAPEVYKRLIIERNTAWAEQLDAVLSEESGTGFVAVGAAHLVGGEASLPALLAAKGYEVTRYGLDETAANDNTPPAE